MVNGEEVSPNLTFRCPPELRKKLIEAGDGKTVGKEIRRRLERSFENTEAGLCLGKPAEYWAELEREMTKVIGFCPGEWIEENIRLRGKLSLLEQKLGSLLDLLRLHK